VGNLILGFTWKRVQKGHFRRPRLTTPWHWGSESITGCEHSDIQL